MITDVIERYSADANRSHLIKTSPSDSKRQLLRMKARFQPRP